MPEIKVIIIGAANKGCVKSKDQNVKIIQTQNAAEALKEVK